MSEIVQTMRDLAEDLLNAGLIPSRETAFDLHSPVNFNTKKVQLITAVYTAGLYPQVIQVIRPPKKFIEVMGAALEKDSEARDFQFFTPIFNDYSEYLNDPSTSTTSTTNNALVPSSAVVDFLQRNVILVKDLSGASFKRVFLHPSSVNFDNKKFAWSNYLLYGEKNQQQGNLHAGGSKKDQIPQSKLMVRNTCEVNAISLVLFGGKIDYLEEESILVIDRWIRFQCTMREFTLVRDIREKLQKVLEYQINFRGDSEKGRVMVDEEEQSRIINMVAELLEEGSMPVN